MQVLSSLKIQDVLYGRYSRDEVIQYIKSCYGQDIEIDEELIKDIGFCYYSDEDIYFESEELLNIYKSILFTEGQAYAPQIAKNEFNFAKESPETYKKKIELKDAIKLLGTTNVQIKLYEGVVGTVKVDVIGE